MPLPDRWWGFLGVAVLAVFLPVASAAQHYPEPNPPVLPGERPPTFDRQPRLVAPTTEWLLHKTLDGQHPDGNEQTMLWFQNRARMDPTAEGIWLATETHSDVAVGRSFFGVDVMILEDEFALLPPTPPAAFDRRIYLGSETHSLDLIARDAQDHDMQFERVAAEGFSHAGASASVFSFAESSLNAHAAFNIDWGPGDGTGMQPGRGHRMGLMGSLSNVGIAMVPESDPGTGVGPLVTSIVYADASSAPDHYNRFIVGTVWEDADGNGWYDPGEGFVDVTVMPDHGDFFAVTAAGGGYAIPITAPADYQLTFSGGDLAGPFFQLVTVGPDSGIADLQLDDVPPGVCGDGVREGSEECDDGNLTDGDGCTSTCTIETVCGDGVREGSEECDDGNTVNGDGCSAECRLESGPLTGLVNATIKLKFNKPSKDSIQLKVKQLILPEGFTAPGSTVSVDVGGWLVVGELDAKGRFKSPLAADSLKLKQRKKDGTWKLTLSRKKGSFASGFDDEGLVDEDNPKPGKAVTVDVSVTAGGVSYQRSLGLLYKSKLGKNGKAKLRE